jgi:prepilin-type processing-associated H-X9-DG protein
MRSTLTVLVPAAAFVVAGGLVLVAIFNVRESASRVRCENNLRQLSIALHMYQDQYGHFPPAAMPNPALPPEKRLSWVLDVLPFVESDQLHSELNRTKSWDAPLNRFAAGLVFGLLQCEGSPVRAVPGRLAPTHYCGIAGVGVDAADLPLDDPRAGFFGYERTLRRADLTRGASQMAVTAETAWPGVPWTAGGPATVRGLDPDGPPYSGIDGQFGGMHRGGAMVLFADGSARHVKRSASRLVWEEMARIAAPDE